MRAITKGIEPHGLTEHRMVPHANYGNFAAIEDLRAALCQEQRGLCCYCTDRIWIRDGNTNIKVEHWRCQARYADQQLVYRNLLAACKGGEGRRGKEQHCDTRKGDSDIRWNPANPDHAIESRICFGMDGSISSPEADFNSHLDDALNLNLEWLKQNRKAALDGLLNWLKLRGPVRKDRLQQELRRLKGEGGTGELEPYSPVPAWWIQRKLGR